MKKIISYLLLIVFQLGPAYSLGEEKPRQSLLENALEESNKQFELTRGREKQFRKELLEQEKILAKLKEQLAREEKISERHETKFNDNEGKLIEKQKLYEERLGAFNELLGVVRQIAADTQVQFENSIISTHDTGRLDVLKNISDQKALPGMEDLASLWQLMIVEMEEQARSENYETRVIDENGFPELQQVTRIGPFVAFNNEGNFLSYNSSTLSYNQLLRQPRKDYQHAAKKYSELSGSKEGVVPVDPSRGAILSLLIQKPTIEERIQHGGVIAYIILILAGSGFLLAISRMTILALLGQKIRKQLLKLDRPSPGNPLGQILQIARDNSQLDIESLELKFDDIILKSSSRMRRGLSSLKVLAGMAPLLGLLGTVTGMIETFQVITLFGSGDAHLMAGGISQALVTTALGLSAAIPILLLHSVANSRSRRLVELLEEQVAGLVADHAQALNEKGVKGK